jgi:CheY-like chemotaxis protein
MTFQNTVITADTALLGDVMFVDPMPGDPMPGDPMLDGPTLDDLMQDGRMLDDLMLDDLMLDGPTPGERDAHTPDRTTPAAEGRNLWVADAARRMPLILVLEDGQFLSDSLRELCGFLAVSVERIDSTEDLLPFLRRGRPMAVVAAMAAEGQDGANVLKTVALHDPSLPVLMMTDGNPALAGAVDAVTELWGLTEVVQAAEFLSPGALAQFLCRAGLRGNCLALLPI